MVPSKSGQPDFDVESSKNSVSILLECMTMKDSKTTLVRQQDGEVSKYIGWVTQVRGSFHRSQRERTTVGKRVK